MRGTVAIVAALLYAWRVYDPKGAYGAFYDTADWLTGWLLAGDGLIGLLRNTVNLVLVDQAEGFLLGIVFLAVVQAPVWAIRRGAGWSWRRLRRLPGMLRRPPATRPSGAAPEAGEGEPLTLVDMVEGPERTATDTDADRPPPAR